eukprot:6187316-Pleurochrysis_carterae.AAC.1
MQCGVPSRRSGITLPGARCAGGPPSLRGMRFPQRFLVHASGDRMFGLSLREATPSRKAPLPSVARTALVDALTSPLRALDACATSVLVATAHRAAVAVAPVSTSTLVSSASTAIRGMLPSG